MWDIFFWGGGEGSVIIPLEILQRLHSILISIYIFGRYRTEIEMNL
jgi:hypothetical protein